MDTLHFRIFFWQKLVPLIALPAAVVLIAVSPFASGKPPLVWVAGAVALAVATVAYAWNIWRKSEILLDKTGLTLHLLGTLQTWPYGKLWQVKQFGKYRVRMCFDPGFDDNEDKHTHMHITVDVFGSDAFVDALLDRYESTTGHELPVLEPAADGDSEQLAA